MCIYVSDEKTETVRQYPASKKVIKAIETILQSDSELVWSETYKGCEVVVMTSDDYDEWLLNR
jgi:hypothetical protein